MEEEIWRDIKGYEGYYQVSNLGRVKSLDRVVEYTNWRGTVGHRLFKGKLIIPSASHDDYMSVALSMNGQTQTCLLHRLVASAFVPNPDNLPQINHKDEHPANNRADNLEWCTAKYNNNYGSHREKLSKAKTGTKASPEAIQHMKEVKSGSNNPMFGRTQSKEARRRIQTALKGRERSTEHCRKLSEANKGKPAWNKGMTRPVICLDQDITFASVVEAAKWLGTVDSPAVQFAATHIACCAGHVFVYADNVPEDKQRYIDYCYTHSSMYKHLASTPTYSLE